MQEADGGIEFIDAVSPPSIRVEDKMARTGSGGHRQERGIIGDKLGSSRIQLVDENAVGAEIVDIDKAIIGRDGSAVGVRRSLARANGAVTRELDLRDEPAEVTGGVDLT